MIFYIIIRRSSTKIPSKMFWFWFLLSSDVLESVNDFTTFSQIVLLLSVHHKPGLEGSFIFIGNRLILDKNDIGSQTLLFGKQTQF